jgi:hypothetical protein
MYWLFPFGLAVAGCTAAAPSAEPADTSVEDTIRAGSPPCNYREAVAKAAIARFWKIYGDNDYPHIVDAQAALQAAILVNPDSGELKAFLAATHWWHVSEFHRDPAPDPAILQQDLPRALQLVQAAAVLAPDDDHLPGFAGVLSVHVGRRAGVPDLVASGERTLDYAVYQFVEFNSFNRWAAYNADPRDSPTFAEGLNALWDAVDACTGTRVDRTNPDVTPYLFRETRVGRKKTCWNNELAPYAFEGLMFNFANGLVKAGQLDAARAAFHNVTLAPNFATWPYRTAFEAVAGSDLEARAALYADADPNNDPPVAVKDRSCVYCHARVPER